MRHFLSILFGGALTVAAAWSLGRVLFARLHISLRRMEHELLAGVTGVALLSLLVFLLCVVRLATIPVFWTVGLGLLALKWKFSSGPTTHADPTSIDTCLLSRAWRWLFASAFGFYALLYLSNSIAPENSPDGQAYHLGLVYRYFRLHGFERLTTNMYSNLSQGMEMLFLFAFSFGRHAAAATVHCCFLFALPLLLLSYGRGIGRPYAGACAAMLFYLSPLAGIDGVSAYNDVALATAAFSTFYLIEIWRREKQPALLIPIGLVAGFCFAIKYTGLVAVAYALVVVLWELTKTKAATRRQVALSLAAVVCFATVMAAPWLAKNWLWLGNPLSPFFNRTFPNPFTHISFEDDYRRYFRSYDLPSLKPLFWMLTVKGQLGGQIGPVFLLTPLALLSLRKPEGRRVLLAGLFFLLPYPQNLGARFLIPALPFAALGIAFALEFSRRVQAGLIVAAALLAWPKNINRYRAPGGGWQIVTMPWKAALGIIPQDKWLLEHSGGWITARMLDEFVPQGKVVWSTTSVAESYTKTSVLVNYYSAEGELIQDILTIPTRPDFQPVWNQRYTFAARMMRGVRLLQQTVNSDHIWSIGEMRFFLGQDEIQPRANWKFTASSFPWDLGLAFDRNPVTRWRSWEPIHPGMYIDIDFGAPLTLDRIELHGSHDQGDIRMVLAGIDAHLEQPDDPPLGDLRRAATATVKARGIDYLLVNGDHWLSADIHGNPGRWGLTKIAERGDAWLFQIQ